MKNMIQNIKGTKDIPADDTFIWQFIEKYINNFFTKYGYFCIASDILTGVCPLLSHIQHQ